MPHRREKSGFFMGIDFMNDTKLNDSGKLEAGRAKIKQKLAYCLLGSGLGAEAMTLALIELAFQVAPSKPYLDAVIEDAWACGK